MSYMVPLLTPIKREQLIYSVREITSYWDRRRFASFSRQIYRGDPRWTPPIGGWQGLTRAPLASPALEGIEIAFFVAESPSRVSGDETVGTVAAVINHRYNELYGENVAFFSALEVVNQPEIAAALLEAAETWIAQRLPGVTAIRGPVVLDPRCAPGLLVDGFDALPAVFMPYQAPYCGEILECAGYEPAADWVAYQIDLTTAGHLSRRHAAIVESTASAATHREELGLSTLSALDLAAGLARVRTALADAWTPSWGNAPPTDAAIEQMLIDLTRWLDPDLCCLAERDGEPVAMVLTLPDVNPARRRLAEIPFPFGWLSYQVARKRMQGVRLLPAWVAPEARGEPIEPRVYVEALAAAARRGYHCAEISPVAEQDRDSSAILQSLGARIAKRYRGYEKQLAPGQTGGPEEEGW